VMKAMGGAKRGPMAGLANMLGLGGGGVGGSMPSPEQMTKLAAKMPGGLPQGTPGGSMLPPNLPGLPPNFPGLPGMPGAQPKLPPGWPGLGKKK
jgi:signal recognition particle subunit SRP54